LYFEWKYLFILFLVFCSPPSNAIIDFPKNLKVKIRIINPNAKIKILLESSKNKLITESVIVSIKFGILKIDISPWIFVATIKEILEKNLKKYSKDKTIAAKKIPFQIHVWSLFFS